MEAFRLGGSEAWRLGGLGAWGLGRKEEKGAGSREEGEEEEEEEGGGGRRRSSWSSLGALGCFLGALEVSCCFLGWPWSGLSRLASMSSALLGALGVEMLQNVAVAKEWAVFLQRCCCNQRSGGVPLQFVSHRPPRSHFTYKTKGF